ncbi:nucleotidyltransferase [uncultured Planococcus sp.]|uniref:nucleotidyltransferase domain-containing protein n=1 Tax=uncultured Planococcus sp. TaxID=337815 RepID=UPI002606D999|nr:nucleotidyltransferase [uncultured Planococcus sp.]
MYQTYSRDHQLDELFQSICEELQISKSQYDQAETSYNAVAKWLSEDEKRFPEVDIDIYPQGSLKTGTTVHPIFNQEFDLDFVCEINLNWEMYEDPIEILDLIEERLLEHEVYAPMVERKNRCIRLNYKRNFHMDILPACPVKNASQGCVKVPDRKLVDWKDSNPKGYASWFEETAKDYDVSFNNQILLEKSAEIEKMPGVEPIQIKPPLKRAVQLMKRYRDIYFEKSPKKAPISIVLTTLAGEFYGNQSSVNDAIEGILDGILNAAQKGKITVYNPQNKLEILSERWDEKPELYDSFLLFIRDFRVKWTEINDAKEKGFIEVAILLKEMFGEEPISKGLNKQAKVNEAFRKSGKLGITAAGLVGFAPTAAAEEFTSVKRNTFYGE